MAPILSYTAEEVWGHLPGSKKRGESVHLALFPEVESQYLDEKIGERFDRLLKVRSEVSKTLEAARKNKLLGNSLEASVILSGPDELLNFLRENEGFLKDLFIVSQVRLAAALGPEAYLSPDVEGLRVLICRAPGQKCDRCWMYATNVGENKEHPSACLRCAAALKVIQGVGR